MYSRLTHQLQTSLPAVQLDAELVESNLVVVQRCPNCGTTRATSGECEACHEAQVRYFCTNHTPGLWLDGATCAECGARFGEPARTSTPRASADAWRSRERSPLAHDEELAPVASRMPMWQQILRAAIRARYMPARAVRYREAPPIRGVARGCAMRLLLVAVSLFLVFAGAVFLFGQALLQGY